jgi:hypothetical protein
MATCRPTLFLLTVKEILLVLFIITNFRVAQKMLCTPWLRNPLTISRLSCFGRKAALATILLSVRQSTISHPWYTNNYLFDVVIKCVCKYLMNQCFHFYLRSFFVGSFFLLDTTQCFHGLVSQFVMNDFFKRFRAIFPQKVTKHIGCA